jgi:hypothetical protein
MNHLKEVVSESLSTPSEKIKIEDQGPHKPKLQEYESMKN